METPSITRSAEQDSFAIGAADIGNSRIKILFGGSVRAVDYRKSPATLGLSAALQSILSEVSNPVKLIYSSVNSTGEVLLNRVAAGLQGLELIAATNLLSKQSIIDYSGVPGMGDDRFIGLIEAASLYGLPVITIDCGSAVTLNAAHRADTSSEYKAECIGGAIFAGTQLQLEALNNFTSKIMVDSLVEPKGVSGLTTGDAVSIGIMASVAGGIMLLVSRMQKQLFFDKPAKVVITGGGAELIIKSLDDLGLECILDNELVLHGLLRLLS